MQFINHNFNSFKYYLFVCVRRAMYGIDQYPLGQGHPSAYNPEHRDCKAVACLLSNTKHSYNKFYYTHTLGLQFYCHSDFELKSWGNWYCRVNISVYKSCNHLYQGVFLIMMLWGFPWHRQHSHQGWYPWKYS